MAQIKGEIVQVIGPVVDVSFEKYGKDLPQIQRSWLIGGDVLI